MFIDTHAHVSTTFYPDDLNRVIDFAVSQNVLKMICASISVEDSLLSINMAKRFPGIVLATVGVHPHCTDVENVSSIEDQISSLDDLINNNRELVCAIGECGLDYTESPPGESDRSKVDQEKLFCGQIELAIRYDLPLIIHCNKAHDELLGILGRYKNSIKGIFHFYAGGKKRLKRFLEFGSFLFGVAGTVTYEEGVQNVVKDIPLDRIVLETDSPFLAPLPHRGEQNQPGYIPYIASAISELKGTPLDEVGRITTSNIEKLLLKKF